VKEAVKIIECLYEENISAYLCGGYVRDGLINLGMFKNKPIKDIDIAVDEEPERVMEVLSRCKYKLIPTGLKHGTFTVVIPFEKENLQIEITTFRSDSNCDGRHADVIYTSSLDEDAKRRDFTVNALYVSRNGQVIDTVGGIQHINNRKLMFVGDAKSRIEEDYLRVLRMFRFIGQLNFKVSRKQMELACSYKHQVLQKISKERIRGETVKILSNKLDNNTLKPIFWVFPILKRLGGLYQNNKYHKNKSVLSHTIKGLNRINTPEPTLKLAFLFHDIGKLRCWQVKDEVVHNYGHEVESCNILKETDFFGFYLSNKEKDVILWLIKYHMARHSFTKKMCRKLLKSCVDELGSDEYMNLLVGMFCADISDRSSYGELIRKESEWNNLIEEVKKETPFIESPLSGNKIIDLMSLYGVTDKRLVGKIKKDLENEVIEGTLTCWDTEKAKNVAINKIMEYKNEIER
jgi:tRNA nucleotidyltransferase/poly(A) polymerase